jgi:hypothetical protein
MKSFKKFLKINEACWTGYKQIGTKEKNGRQVPNCVPEEADLDESTIDKNHPIAKEYFDLKKKNLKDLKDMITQRSKISDTSEFRSKEHAASHLIRRIHGDKKVDQVFGFNEEADLDEAYVHTDFTDRTSPLPNKKAYAVDKANDEKKPVSLKKAPWDTKKEEVEELDELKKSTLGSYVRKASVDAYRRGQDTEYHTAARDATDNYGAKRRHAELTDKARAKASNRITGIEKATRKLANEEVKINEVSELRITKVYNKFPKKATYAVHSPDRKYYKEFDSMEKAKAHHAEKTGK